MGALTVDDGVAALFLSNSQLKYNHVDSRYLDTEYIRMDRDEYLAQGDSWSDNMTQV